MNRTRKTLWPQKVEVVENCLLRCMSKDNFANTFYRKLFFLNPKLEESFKNTDWEHQQKALLFAVEHLIGFFKEDDKRHHRHIARIAETHSQRNLNIHPHSYYYWIDAMVLTLKEMDHLWENKFEFYVRECLFFPVSFIISLYHK
jgi:hemoglobin-like flavoprotein